MGCSASLPRRGAARTGQRVVESVERPDASVHAASLRASRSFKAGILQEINALPDTLLDDLYSLQSFDHALLSPYTNRPLRLIAFLLLREPCEAVDADSHRYLCESLESLEREIRRCGHHVYTSKLLTIQFFLTEVQPGCGLFQLRNTDPIRFVALCLAALTDKLHSLCSKANSSISGTSSGEQVCMEPTRASTWPAVRRFIAGTGYFRVLSVGNQTRLLSLIGSLIAPHGAQSFHLLLLQHDDENDDANNKGMSVESLEGATTLLHSSLFIASHSHIFRKFSTHIRWCAERVAMLQNSTILDEDSKRTEFAFFPAAERSARFGGLQIWFLSNVMLDFVSHWVEETRTSNGHELRTRLASTVMNYAKLHSMPESAVPQNVRRLVSYLKTSSDKNIGAAAAVPPSSQLRQVKSAKVTQANSNDQAQNDVMADAHDDDAHDGLVPDDWAGLSSLCSLYYLGTSCLSGFGSEQQ